MQTAPSPETSTGRVTGGGRRVALEILWERKQVSLSRELRRSRAGEVSGRGEGMEAERGF